MIKIHLSPDKDNTVLRRWHKRWPTRQLLARNGLINLDSSPKASTPKCSHTAGQNCSLQETKSSSRLKQTEEPVSRAYFKCHGPEGKKTFHLFVSGTCWRFKVVSRDYFMGHTHLPSSSPRPRSKMRFAPSSSSLLSTYFPMAL